MDTAVFLAKLAPQFTVAFGQRMAKAALIVGRCKLLLMLAALRALTEGHDANCARVVPQLRGSHSRSRLASAFILPKPGDFRMLWSNLRQRTLSNEPQTPALAISLNTSAQCPADHFGRAGLPFVILLLTATPGLSQNIPSANADLAAMQSDSAAIQTMRNVLAQSGGQAAWGNVSSAEESFEVLRGGEKGPHLLWLLDDWSLNTTRYRRGLQGRTTSPADHNGAPTFPLNTGQAQVAVPEFDQARTLVPRFPAAAAQVMLRTPAYVLKISKSQICTSGEICVDVFQINGSAPPGMPEQQWKISAVTGLPVTVRYQTETVGNLATVVWREVFFLKYATENGLTIPVSILVNLRGKRESWTFASLKLNPGFDTNKFDREIAQ